MWWAFILYILANIWCAWHSSTQQPSPHSSVLPKTKGKKIPIIFLLGSKLAFAITLIGTCVPNSVCADNWIDSNILVSAHFLFSFISFLRKKKKDLPINFWVLYLHLHTNCHTFHNWCAWRSSIATKR